MAKTPSNVSAAAKLEKALRKISGDEVADAILECSPEELRARLVKLGTYEMETLKAKEDDEALADATELVKTLKAPYGDAIKGVNAQRQFVSVQLEKAGQA